MITSPKGQVIFSSYVFPRSHVYFVIRKKKNHTIIYYKEKKIFRIRPGIFVFRLEERYQVRNFREKPNIPLK